MTELKTLKDFRTDGNSGNPYAESRDLTLDELKQEAIKHIKENILKIEAHSHQKFVSENSYLACTQCRNYFIQIQWIKYFFNITDEELV